MFCSTDHVSHFDAIMFENRFCFVFKTVQSSLGDMYVQCKKINCMILSGAYMSGVFVLFSIYSLHIILTV